MSQTLPTLTVAVFVQNEAKQVMELLNQLKTQREGSYTRIETFLVFHGSTPATISALVSAASDISKLTILIVPHVHSEIQLYDILKKRTHGTILVMLRPRYTITHNDFLNQLSQRNPTSTPLTIKLYNSPNLLLQRLGIQKPAGIIHYLPIQ